MPKAWIIWNDHYKEWVLCDSKPTNSDRDIVEVEMNASLFRQIRAAEEKFEKFQGILEKFYAEGVEHPNQVRRVR